MKRSEINKLSRAQVNEWLRRNSEPGVLPAVPVIMISTLAGEHPGITMNFVKNMDINTIAAILQAALNQVEAKIKEMEQN